MAVLASLISLLRSLFRRSPKSGEISGTSSTRSMRFPWHVSVSSKDSRIRIADRDCLVVCGDLKSREVAEYIIDKCGARPFVTREEWMWGKEDA